MMEKRLLNCPLCGSEAEIVEIGNEFFPRCKGGDSFCLLNRIPMEGYDGFKHLKDAIEAWNRRSGVKSSPALIHRDDLEIFKTYCVNLKRPWINEEGKSCECEVKGMTFREFKKYRNDHRQEVTPQQSKTTVIGEEIPEIVEYAKQLGFIELPHFTIGGNLICDIGRDRRLSLACAGTPNEMLCICTLNALKDVYDDVIVVHNYDYDGYLTREKLKNIVNVFKNKDVDNE